MQGVATGCQMQVGSVVPVACGSSCMMMGACSCMHSLAEQGVLPCAAALTQLPSAANVNTADSHSIIIARAKGTVK
jgi:hypothetical protein